MKASIFSVICCFALLACAQQQQGFWLKPGAPQDEFSSVRYTCMQQSQQPVSAAYIDKYGGVANSNVITNSGLMAACLNAQGYYFVSVSDQKAYGDSLSALRAEQTQACSRADLQSLFAKKMACKAKEATPEQLSDRSKISEAEKIAFDKWRQFIEESNQKAAAINRQYVREKGDVFASVIERRADANERLASQLSDGRISWGEYNKNRSELDLRTDQELKSALH